MQDHHQPPPSAIVQRFNFHSRSRRQGETVSAFVAELRKLTEYCQFGDTLSYMRRDRLVCGINDQKLQRRLLAEPTLTYEKAFALAQALETADKSAKELEKASGVHFMQPHSRPKGTPAEPQRQGQACYRCGGTNHSSATCRFKDSDCLHCGKKGHIAKVCRSRGNNSTRPQRGRRQPMQSQPKPSHLVDEEPPEDPVYTNFPCNRPTPVPNGRYYATQPDSPRHGSQHWKLPQPRSSASKPISHSGRQRKPLPYSPVRLNSVPTQG